MKIAYTINGLIGGFVGKNSARNDLESRSLILEYTFNSIKDCLMSNHDIDFYIYSWEPYLKEEFERLYKPTKSQYVNQIKFDVPSDIKNDGRTQSHYSRWYGVKQLKNMINDSGVEYDMIINTRMDLHWNRIQDFTNLNIDKIHVAIHPTTPHFLPMKKNGSAICDHFVMMNPQLFDSYGDLYDSLDEYVLPKNHKCRYSHISHHLLIPQHLRKLGVVDKLEPTIINHHDAGVGTGDYDIFRYKKLTKKQVENELQRR